MKRKLSFGPIRSKYQGKIFAIKERDVYFPDGSKTVFEYCERPTSVSILAFNEKNELLLIKEWRPGYDKNVWFLPGGRADHNHEKPKTAAIREMREETGFRPKKIRLIHKKAPASTLIWDIYTYAARDLVLDPLPKDKGEVTEPVFVPLKKAVGMAVDGTIENEFIAYNIIRFDYMLRHGEFSW